MIYRESKFERVGHTVVFYVICAIAIVLMLEVAGVFPR